MKNIKINEMIITCESCGNVKRFRAHSQEDCDKVFKEFKCENNCGRNLYSFIAVGSLERKTYHIPEVNLQYAIAK